MQDKTAAIIIIVQFVVAAIAVSVVLYNFFEQKSTLDHIVAQLAKINLDIKTGTVVDHKPIYIPRPVENQPPDPEEMFRDPATGLYSFDALQKNLARRKENNVETLIDGEG